MPNSISGISVWFRLSLQTEQPSVTAKISEDAWNMEGSHSQILSSSEVVNETNANAWPHVAWEHRLEHNSSPAGCLLGCVCFGVHFSEGRYFWVILNCESSHLLLTLECQRPSLLFRDPLWSNEESEAEILAFITGWPAPSQGTNSIWIVFYKAERCSRTSEEWFHWKWAAIKRHFLQDIESNQTAQV